MADWIARYRELWNRYQGRQRYIIVGSAAAFLILLLGISFWYGSKPELVPLYTNLEAKDAGDIVNSLKESGTQYSVEETKNGTTIFVLPKDVHNTRLELAVAGLPRGSKGFEIFDDSKLGVTEFQNKVNYLQALQGELTRTIEQLDAVEKARVHIVLPEDSLYKKKEKPATASIMLVLNHDIKLKEREVKGIVNLVSHSVQGLTTDNVTIVDEKGNILNETEDPDLLKQKNMSMQALAQIEMTQKVRDHIQENIQSMLDQSLGPGNAFARVSVELDFDEKKTDRQTFTPVVDESGIIRSQQDVTESYSGESNIPGGPAGVQSNIPGYIAEERNANAEYERKESTKNYEVNEENQRIIASPGSIRRLTVAVLVNDTITELQQEGLLRAVASAAGINEERGDTISVEALPFSNEAREQLSAAEYAERKRQERILYTEIGALLLLSSLLIGGFLMYRRRKQQERLAEEEAILAAERERQRLLEEERAQAVESGEIDESQLTPEERNQLDEKKAIMAFIDEHPTEAAILVKQWLEEDG
ncbi:MAG: flagellar M-ring protein FliF [Selenomonadaceae bacterium]|nr:flagellar M-ring protein FliF [Selenomonadaceae bacterium]